MLTAVHSPIHTASTLCGSKSRRTVTVQKKVRRFHVCHPPPPSHKNWRELFLVGKVLLICSNKNDFRWSGTGIDVTNFKHFKIWNLDIIVSPSFKGWMYVLIYFTFILFLKMKRKNRFMCIRDLCY